MAKRKHRLGIDSYRPQPPSNFGVAPYSQQWLDTESMRSKSERGMMPSDHENLGVTNFPPSQEASRPREVPRLREVSRPRAVAANQGPPCYLGQMGRPSASRASPAGAPTGPRAMTVPGAPTGPRAMTARARPAEQRHRDYQQRQEQRQTNSTVGGQTKLAPEQLQIPRTNQPAVAATSVTVSPEPAPKEEVVDHRELLDRLPPPKAPSLPYGGYPSFEAQQLAIYKRMTRPIWDSEPELDHWRNSSR